MPDLCDYLQQALGDSYRIERELPAGGMSRLFLATERSLQRQVVVKLLPPELASEVSAERFRREMLLAARLQHPHILPVLNAGAKDGLLYYVMPYVPGESLRARLKREGRLPISDAMRIFRDVVDALACAHEEGVVHRDVKPENVLLERGHAVLADFGVARALEQATLGDRLTGTGLGLGTPGYMAPEQLAGEPGVDARADLYALGIIAYEMLAGVPPFGGATMQRVVAAHFTEAPEALETLRPDVPPALAALVMRLLAKDPAGRPQSAGEVLRELEAVATPSGAGTTAPAALATREAPRPTRRVLSAAVVALLLGAAAYAALARGRAGPARNSTAPAAAVSPDVRAGTKSVAVLPFVNLSAERENDYFADGMTEELIGALSRVQGLRVPGRTSVFALKGRNLDARAIGDTLHVATVLEGSVRRSGGRLRVGAQLVSARDNNVLWSESYDRELEDVFQVQDELARAIVGALRVRLRLTSGGDTTLVRPPTADLAAHDLYLQGRFLWNQRTYESLLQAARFFERAIARDSGYAQAYAGLADAYVVLPFYGPASPREAYPRAKAAALRALALDSTLAEAHTALAYSLELADYDWAGAEAEFRRAIALDANYATAHHWYAEHLSIVGRHREALAEFERARALDPLSRIIGTDQGLALARAGRYDDALRQLRATLELDPNFFAAHLFLCSAYLVGRRSREAVPECERAVALSGRNGGLGHLAYARAASGDRARATAVLRELEARVRREYVAPSDVALAHLGLGDADGALQWLERAVASRDPLVLTYAFHPGWDPLRADARFQRLRARMKLP